MTVRAVSGWENSHLSHCVSRHAKASRPAGRWEILAAPVKVSAVQKGFKHMAKNAKQTSCDVAALAARLLNNTSASDVQKSLAAAALAQSRTGKQTSAAMEDLASKVLASSRYAEDTKTLAGSVLSQSNKKR